MSVSLLRQPMLLLSYHSSAELQRPPISLQHLTVEFGIRFEIRGSFGAAEDTFVVVSLRDDEIGMLEAFCLVGDALVAALPVTPSASDIAKVIRELVEVMSALSQPSSRALAGLWAELWLMAVAADRSEAVAAWHVSTKDRLDFSFSDHHIEVKATELEDRNHEFSYEQLRGSALPITVVSLRLRRSPGGSSVLDLVSALQTDLSLDMRKKLVRNVFGAVGNAISEASEVRYDESFAGRYLRTIPAEKVPVVLIPDGSPISAVRFRVDLGDSSLSDALMKAAPERALLSSI